MRGDGGEREQPFLEIPSERGSPCYSPVLGLVWRGAGWEGKVTSELSS